MAQYTGYYISTKKEFFISDDVDIDFIIRDANGDLVTDFTSIGIKAEITDGSSETKLETDGSSGDNIEISTLGAVVSLHLADTETEDYSAGDFDVEIQLTISTKVYTVYLGTITFLDEEIDW